MARKSFFCEDLCQAAQDGIALIGADHGRKAEGLQQFIEQEVSPKMMNTRTEIENRPLLCSQALGESLDPGRMGELAKHEFFLDRKLENTLALLMKLQKARRSLAA